MIKSKTIILMNNKILLNQINNKNLKENFILWMLKIKFLGDKKFFVSDEVTFADFHIYELLDVLQVKLVPFC